MRVMSQAQTRWKNLPLLTDLNFNSKRRRVQSKTERVKRTCLAEQRLGIKDTATKRLAKMCRPMLFRGGQR
jgi:hypothetical protein